MSIYSKKITIQNHPLTYEQKISINKGCRDGIYAGHGAADIDWKQKHSQSVTEFIRKYDIREEQLPVLFIWNLERNCYSVVSLNHSEDMYSFLKQRVLEQENLMKQKQKLEEKLLPFKQERMYFELYDFLNERACRLGCSEKEAIQSVLFGQSTYLEKKDQIQDKEIRKDLKKIGQWKKQFFTNPSDIPQIKNHVKEMLEKKMGIEYRIDSIWEKIGNKGEMVTLTNDIVKDVILLLQRGVRLTIMILKKIRKNTQTHKHTNTQYTHNTQNETMKTTHQKEKETTK